MAGLYPDVPGIKFQYDVDGSAGFDQGGTALSGAQLSALNDETQTNVVYWGNAGAQYVGIIFPELRDLAGWWWQVPDQGFVSGWAVSTSADTTNGVDGTWTQRSTTAPSSTMTFRTGINVLAVAGIKAIRVGIASTTSTNGNRNLTALHVYGTIPALNSPDRLRIWHPTLDQEMGAAGFDYGDFGRGGTLDRTFRVKNNSSSLTANSIVLSREAPTDTTPSVVAGMTISQGGAFATTQNIGNLAPGAISGVCTLRIASTSSTVLGIWRQRLVATAGSWT